jgi:histidine triad (HIT) family protein
MKKENDCIFCKIIAKEIPAEIIWENEDLIVLQDIKPSAPFHHLIIPKEHIKSIADLEEKDREIVSKLIFTAKNDAEKANLKGYKLSFNVGRDGGQIIDHIHLHLMGGWGPKNS